MPDLVTEAARRKWAETRKRRIAAPHGRIRQRQSELQAAMTARLKAEEEELRR
jgi:hypothetical protein